jgi:hypothetical protein
VSFLRGSTFAIYIVSAFTLKRPCDLSFGLGNSHVASKWKSGLCFIEEPNESKLLSCGKYTNIFLCIRFGQFFFCCPVLYSKYKSSSTLLLFTIIIYELSIFFFEFSPKSALILFCIIFLSCVYMWFK